MRTVAVLLILAALLPDAARAQAPADGDPPPPPPLVDAPSVEPVPGPPPPPPPAYVPGAPQTGYPYSPATPPPPPGPEVGLMITESLFGMLTAGGTSLLMWYMLLKPLGAQLGTGPDGAMVGNLIFILGFSSVPMAVAQSELGLANGSAYYYSESWPAALFGLLAQAAVIGLYYWARPLTPDQGEAVLLLGTIVAVPLAEMVAINLTKLPRWKLPPGSMKAALTLDEEGALRAGLPLPSPILLQTAGGPRLGLGLSLLNGRF